jgi:hypothetical protein
MQESVFYLSFSVASANEMVNLKESQATQTARHGEGDEKR